MRFAGEPVEGRLVRRVNRFVARVWTDQGEVLAHVPNSGRLTELLFPGNRVMLRATSGKGRRTGYTLVLAAVRDGWACVVSAYANALTKEAVDAGLLPDLDGYPVWRPEASWGGSRFDFLLTGSGRPPCLVEVKGVTLLGEGGQALFPDAPTARGARHLRELARAVREGYRAAVVFAVKLPGARVVRPFRERDEAFAAALEDAEAAGVEVFAFGCRVTTDGIWPDGPLPVVTRKPPAERKPEAWTGQIGSREEWDG